MKRPATLFNLFLFVSLLISALGFSTSPVSADGEPYVCLPTCSVSDARFFAIAGVGNVTLAGQSIFIKVAVPSTMSSFQLGFFDGDTSGLWDKGTSPLVYTLLADPNANQTGTQELIQWTGSSLADNAWTDITIAQDPSAQAPSGDYFYSLKVELPDAASTSAISSFKIRSNSPLELTTNKTFAFEVPMITLAEAKIIYPQYPSLTTTTFDGTWDMYLNVPVSQESFQIWDGDMDYGSFDCSQNDTDDPDTSNEVFPPFAMGISDVLEGVAQATVLCRNAAGQVAPGPNGQVYTTGAPADESRAPAYKRGPSIVYEVTDPQGNTYLNSNPSGNSEWEQFLISSDSNLTADYHVADFLPAGIYKIHIYGLDLFNLNSWHLPYEHICVYEDGSPCVPTLKPYKVGDTIWNDLNGNGIQDDGENGIPGVSVTLIDANGNPLPGGTAVTDENGKYSFGVDSGVYSVQVNESNFQAGGALAAYVSTTGGNSQTNTITTDNVLAYDFGYRQLASVGDRVWNDANANGIQDDGETGLGGVGVQLLASDGVTVVATTTTADDGSYSFASLSPDTYYVQFTAPLGYALSAQNVAGSTSANDSDADPSTSKTGAITLGAGAAETNVDAGFYQPASIGDRVWNDANANGIQEDGEAGLGGVTVQLLGSDGVTVVATTTSAADGSYSFTNLAPGTYYVQFVALSGYSITTQNAVGSTSANNSDVDASTGKTGAITLGAGVTETNVDAGLYQPASIGDQVWKDANANGIQDGGEVGLGNVTVQLLSSDGVTVVATTTSAADGSYSFANLVPGTYYVQFTAPSGYTFTTQSATGSTSATDSDADAATGKTGAITVSGGTVQTSIDAGLKQKQVINYCSFIRSPGFWKNYKNHMSSSAFLTLISKTQDFSYLTVTQAVAILSKNNGSTQMGIPALDGVNASYLKFLLTSQLNAVWNGNEKAPAPGGILGTGTYQGTNMTVNELLHQAYLDRRNYSSEQLKSLQYLGAGGENAAGSSGDDLCLVQP